MNVRSVSSPLANDQRGIALLTTILMMVLMSALLVGFTTAVMSDQSSRTVDRDRARAFYGAQSGIEKQNADLARLFVSQVGPSNAQIAALGAAALKPTIPNVTFVTTGASPDYQVAPVGGATSGIISSGPYAGLMALKRQVQLDATARSIDGGEVHLRRLVEAVAIPVFQFGIFSDVDLAFNAADNFNFGGRVHTNRNLFLAEGSGNTLWLRDRVSAFGEIIRTELSNGVTLAGAGQNGTVNMTRGNQTGPFRPMLSTEGSLLGGPTTGPNPNWSTVSLSTYVGNIRNWRTGVTPLNLDLIAANGANIDLIKRPPSTEAVSSAIFAERYFKKVSLRILLSDTANDITSLPTVSAGNPVRLDTWSAPDVPPVGYVIAANRPPVARSAGPIPDAPAGSANATVNVGVNAGAAQNITMNPSLANIFRVPATMTLTWGPLFANSMTVSCTGKDALSFLTCSRVLPGLALPQTLSLPANITALVQTADGPVTVTRALTTNIALWSVGTTKTITIGIAGFPTAPFSVNTFFIRDKNLQITCTGYNATPQFTGCNVPAGPVNPVIAVGDRLSTGYLSPQGTGTLGGFLKVEIQTAPDVWQDVTLEFLNYGIGDRNLSGRPCGDPTTDAILRMQRLRDNNEPGVAACTYVGSTTSTDYWPNVLFDVREAVSRDAVPAGHNGRVLLGGVMHYVALDAQNLSEWFARQGVYAAGTGNLAMREGGSPTAGFSVYFSDRRNNRTAANLETGEFGYEDVVNPGSGTGAPDGVLNTGEDVNANGLLDTYGQTAHYSGVGGVFTVPGTFAAPMNAAALPTTFVSGGEAKVNRPLHFRRALKLVNGILGNLVAPGLTVASENAVYLQGDWNASRAAGWTGASVATSIAADTVVALSNDWSDLNSFGPPTIVATSNLNPYDITVRPRSADTYYRVALISGKGRIFPRPASGGGTYGTDGGAHNFIRFIEGNSTGGNNTVWYQGSMVTFYYARQNLMPHKCCNNFIYGVPSRQYLFDTNFLNPTLLPPLTPAFRDINALGFTQETRPGR